MSVVKNRINRVRRRRVVRIMRILNEALAVAPTVVFASARIRSEVYVHLLTVVFPDIANQQIACRKNKTRAKRIAQTIAENLLFDRGDGAKEWIIERDGVAPVVFDVDTQDFSEQGLRALGVAIRKVRISGLIFQNPTITRADVKIIFIPYARAEANPVKVMIVLRLIGSDYRYFASWIGDIGV